MLISSNSTDHLVFVEEISCPWTFSATSHLNQSGPILYLVHRIIPFIKKNLQLDWTKKEDARAAIRLTGKMKLRGVVEFSDLDKNLAQVIEQTERQYGEWPIWYSSYSYGSWNLLSKLNGAVDTTIIRLASG